MMFISGDPYRKHLIQRYFRTRKNPAGQNIRYNKVRAPAGTRGSNQGGT